MKSHKLQGFSVLEIVLTLSIAALITTGAFVYFGNYRYKANDAARIHEVQEIQSALEEYRRDAGYYPQTITPGQPLVTPSGKKVMDKVPQNPSPTRCKTRPTTSEFVYKQFANGASYGILFCQDNSIGNLTPGKCVATPNNNCDALGDECLQPNCDWTNFDYLSDANSSINGSTNGKEPVITYNKAIAPECYYDWRGRLKCNNGHSTTYENIYTFFYQNKNFNFSRYDLRDLSNTWTPVNTIYTAQGDISNPLVASKGDNSDVFVAFWEGAPANKLKVMHRSPDNSYYSQDSFESTNFDLPCAKGTYSLAAYTDTAYIVCSNTTTDKLGIYYLDQSTGSDWNAGLALESGGPVTATAMQTNADDDRYVAYYRPDLGPGGIVLAYRSYNSYDWLYYYNNAWRYYSNSPSYTGPVLPTIQANDVNSLSLTLQNGQPCVGFIAGAITPNIYCVQSNSIVKLRDLGTTRQVSNMTISSYKNNLYVNYTELDAMSSPHIYTKKWSGSSWTLVGSGGIAGDGQNFTNTKDNLFISMPDTNNNVKVLQY